MAPAATAAGAAAVERCLSLYLQLGAAERQEFWRAAERCDAALFGGGALPHEVFQRRILPLLGLADVLAVARCCRVWRDLASDATIYEALVRRDFDVVIDGWLADTASICWRRLAREVAAHKAHLLSETERLGQAIRGASSAVRPFLTALCGQAGAEDGGVYTFHAPRATPIHYRRRDGADAWIWSADSVSWMGAEELEPRGGHFGRIGARLVDENVEIVRFLRLHNPRPSPLFRSTRYRLRGRAPFDKGARAAEAACGAEVLLWRALRDGAFGAFLGRWHSGVYVLHMEGSSPVRVLLSPDDTPGLWWSTDGGTFRSIEDRHGASGELARVLAHLAAEARDGGGGGDDEAPRRPARGR